MKKWLAVLVAAVMVASSFSMAFAADISDLKFKPASDIDFLANILPQFNQGNGKYIIPVDFNNYKSPSGGNYSTNYSYFESRFNSDSYFHFYFFLLHMTVFFAMLFLGITSDLVG